MKCKLITLLLLPASALAFTPAETQALKAAALAEPSVQQCIIDGNDGCVADHLIYQADRNCYGVTQTKDQYRDCLVKEYESFKADIDAAICEITK